MENLLSAQTEFLEQLKKAERNLKKASHETRAKSSYLKARMEILDKLDHSFNQNHLKIISMVTKEQKTVLTYFNEDVHDTFQEGVITYKTLLNDYLNLNNQSDYNKTMPNKKESNSEAYLPRIKLPVFTGKYTEWQSFYDMFVSLIHENSSLLPVQKLHYLKTSLTGEPELLLRNFPTTSANYQEAWDQLIKRFNNKKYNCNAILKTLFAQKSLQYESANSIRQLLDTTTSCLKALDNLDIKTKEWDVIIIFLVVSKLDTESHRQWENHVSTIEQDLPEWSELENFLERRFRSLEMVDTSKQPSSAYKTNMQHTNSNQVVKPRAFHSALNLKPSSSEQLCAMCNGPHYIYYCSQFKNQPAVERQNIVKNKRLCFNCLAPTHPVYKCHQHTSCRKCGRKHHTLLHFEDEDKQAYWRQREESEGHAQQRTSETPNHKNEETVVVNFSRGDLKTYNVLLPTAVVKTSCKNDSSFVIRALLDQGSQASFISEDTVKLLGLKRTNIDGKVSGLGDGQMRVKHIVSLKVESRVKPGKIIRVNAYVLKSLTSVLPSHEVKIPEWLELKNLPLADPEFTSPGKVDVLLGADVYGEILIDGIKKSPYGNLIAQNTVFGWILSGKVSQELNIDNIKTLPVKIKKDELLKTLEEYKTINHMRSVNHNNINNHKAVYSPSRCHHAVLRKDENTTKKWSRNKQNFLNHAEKEKLSSDNMMKML